ncbi:MAG: hypothetical protein HRT35_20510 [Algicola sp.]|nr:hypothetical protein [Algicola sp.]
MIENQLYDYDPATALDNPEAIEVFMADAFSTGDPDYIVKAIKLVARAKGMTQLIQATENASE